MLNIKKMIEEYDEGSAPLSRRAEAYERIRAERIYWARQRAGSLGKSDTQQYTDAQRRAREFIIDSSKRTDDSLIIINYRRLLKKHFDVPVGRMSDNEVEKMFDRKLDCSMDLLRDIS